MVDWPALERTVRRWLHRRAPAPWVDDLTQETLLRVHRTLPTDARSPEAWALRSAHSTLVDQLRAQARRVDAATDPQVLAALSPLTPGDATDRPDAGLDAAADRALDVAIAQCLGRTVQRLPAVQREAIELVSADGLSSAEAARRAGVSVAGLKSRVQRGRRTVVSETGKCCQIERDARGRPISLTPRAGTVCRCGCADDA
ncbi:MAG: sigma-70 family RNA polymerase sigma factor [Solirubrobacteraceae bacterium]|nr:sigma-70 family RNA polymerase sigma factor [Solirubrobacteraceae bacterium]